MSHLVGQYIQNIINQNSNATVQFGNWLNSPNSNGIVNTMAGEINEMVNMFVACGLNQQQVLQRVCDVMADGLYFRYVQNNQHLLNSMGQNEINYINNAAVKTQQLKNDCAQAVQTLQSRGNNSFQNGAGFSWNTNSSSNGASSANIHSVQTGIGLLDIGTNNTGNGNNEQFQFNVGNNNANNNQNQNNLNMGTSFFDEKPAVQQEVKQQEQTQSFFNAAQVSTINVKNVVHIPIEIIVTLGDNMKLEYSRHERNAEFYERLVRKNELVPEDHIRVVTSYLDSFSPELGTIVANEPVRLGFVEESIDIEHRHPGFTLTAPTYVRADSEIAFALESNLANRLGEQATAIRNYDKTPIKGAVLISKDYFLDKDVAGKIEALQDSTNILQLAEGLKNLLGDIPDMVWYDIDRKLTTYINNYLCSTLPLNVTVDSFVNDAADLVAHINATVQFEQVNEEYDTHYRLCSDVLKAFGNYLWQTPEELGRSAIVEVDEESAEQTGEAVATAAVKASQVHNYIQRGALTCDVMKYVALTRFSAAELQIAIPRLNDAPTQPTGGIIDPTTLPELNKLIETILNEAHSYELNEAYLFTSDGFYLRASNAVMMNAYVLDMPVPIQ